MSKAADWSVCPPNSSTRRASGPRYISVQRLGGPCTAILCC